MSIGEVLNFPINMVEVPDYNFVRCEFEDKTYVNWDNNSGQTFTDDYFRKGLTPTSSSVFTF